MLRLWTAAVVAAVLAWGIKLLVGVANPIISALAVLGAYGVVYLGLTTAMGVQEAKGALGRLRRLRR
jgi:hypothetical protein